MKRITAWGVINRTALKVTDERLPLFWLKQVADKFAEKTNGTVIKVTVDESY